MKRATIWKGRVSEEWWVDICPAEDWREGTGIQWRARYGWGARLSKPHPTHGAALAYALAEVGLGTPPEHREAP